MELNIGQNIKKMRLSKGMTQEQLAELLCISTAAISKWEAKNTYPDITMLLPLANIFGVTVDELMGHDAEREQREVESILHKHRELQISGRVEDAKTLIINARKTYPHDYRIMRAYMWSIAGGEADNDKQTLLEHRDEFMQISECILDGCKDERLRLDALTMQAKLYHAAGETERALGVLENFPTSFQTASIKTEQLFSKDTAEYRYWNRRNLYGFLDVTANKAVRMIWYDDQFAVEDKIEKIERLGDALSTLRHDMPLFAIPEQMVFAELANKLSSLDCVRDVIRIRKKQFDAMKALRELAKTDAVLKECLLRTYKTDDPVKWLYEYLRNASHGQFVRLRQNKAYCEMLSDIIQE